LPACVAMSAIERQRDELASRLRELLIERRRADAARGREPGGDLPLAVKVLVEREAAILPPFERDQITARILRDTVGLGPLEPLLGDPEVEEVMVNGPDWVYVERGGRIEPTRVHFSDEGELRNSIERILAPLGRRVDELSPMVDARLADGSRVNVVIPPLAVDGPAVSIRRFAAARPGPQELVELGTLAPAMGDLLATAVRDRRSVLVSGGTGSGKTTLLNAMSSSIATGERVVTIEDAAELRLQQPHVVRLESRPASVEGRGEVTIRDLLRNALRMRPDRIVIGEVRGPEALDLLTALNTGHRGALSTVHANSPADALRRLETLALMAGVGLPHAAIREQLGRGFELVVHLERLPDGRRVVVEIAEVVRVAGGPATRALMVREAGGARATGAQGP
jgi:pilus assembly protein CpaF